MEWSRTFEGNSCIEKSCSCLRAISLELLLKLERSRASPAKIEQTNGAVSSNFESYIKFNDVAFFFFFFFLTNSNLRQSCRDFHQFCETQRDSMFSSLFSRYFPDRLSRNFYSKRNNNFRASNRRRKIFLVVSRESRRNIVVPLKDISRRFLLRVSLIWQWKESTIEEGGDE